MLLMDTDPLISMQWKHCVNTDLLFVENFHGVIAFTWAVLNEHHSTERACAQSSHLLEVV